MKRSVRIHAVSYVVGKARVAVPAAGGWLEEFEPGTEEQAARLSWINKSREEESTILTLIELARYLGKQQIVYENEPE